MQFPPAPSAVLQEIEGYLISELELIRQNPLKYSHRPHAQQEQYLGSKARRRIVVAANRVGKTESAMRDVLWCARGDHPYRKVPCVDQLWVGAPDYPSYMKFTKPAFEQWCPPGWIAGEFHESDKWVDIRRVDGGRCRIFFLSYDMPRSKWQGAGVGGIWLDEECPEDIVKECLARIVTTRGWIALTFTPVEGVGWWFDRIFDPATKGKNKWQAFQWALATFDEANEADFNVGHSLVPHLTREEVVEFASEYPDPDERAIRIFGEVRARTGLVYKGYRHHVHRIPRFSLPVHYELWGAVDPGYHGFAAIIGAMSPRGRLYVALEFFSQQETVRARFQALVVKVRGLRSREEWRRVGDTTVVFFVDTEDPQVVLELNTQAAMLAEEERIARTDQEDAEPEVALAFASLDQGLKARKAGFLRVQQALEPARNRMKPEVVGRPTPAEGEPLLYFFDDLYSEWQDEDEFHKESRLLWEIQRYEWKKPVKGSTVKPDDAAESTAGGAHGMATLRYLVMARLGPPVEPRRDERAGLSQHDRDVWEDVDEIESQQLEELM